MPPAYIAALMFGNGLSGISTTIVEICLTLALPGNDNLFTQAVIFFVWAVLVLLLSALVFPVVMNSPFYKYYAAG